MASKNTVDLSEVLRTASQAKRLLDSQTEGEKNIFADCCVVVGKKRFTSNRFLLATGSSWFEHYFQAEPDLQKSGTQTECTVTLPDLDGDAVGSILNCFVAGQLMMDGCELEHLCRAADYLQMDFIKDGLLHFARHQGLEQALEGDAEHAAYLLKLAKLGTQYNCHKLLAYACHLAGAKPALLGDWPDAAFGAFRKMFQKMPECTNQSGYSALQKPFCKVVREKKLCECVL